MSHFDIDPPTIILVLFLILLWRMGVGRTLRLLVGLLLMLAACI